MSTGEGVSLIVLVVLWSAVCGGVGYGMATDSAFSKIIQGDPILIKDRYHQKTYSCAEVVNNG